MYVNQHITQIIRSYSFYYRSEYNTENTHQTINPTKSHVFQIPLVFLSLHINRPKDDWSFKIPPLQIYWFSKHLRESDVRRNRISLKMGRWIVSMAGDVRQKLKTMIITWDVWHTFASDDTSNEILTFSLKSRPRKKQQNKVFERE